MPTLSSVPDVSEAAILEFRGFPSTSLDLPAGMAVWIPCDGAPIQVARWFAVALARDSRPQRFAATCLAHGAPPWRPLGGPDDPRRQVIGSHRYRLGLGGRSHAALGLQCWRRYGHGLGWQRRCGPMPLPAFISHFGSHGNETGLPLSSMAAVQLLL
jgi:hypothetical protein